MLVLNDNMVSCDGPYRSIFLIILKACPVEQCDNWLFIEYFHLWSYEAWNQNNKMFFPEIVLISKVHELNGILSFHLTVLHLGRRK